MAAQTRKVARRPAAVKASTVRSPKSEDRAGPAPNDLACPACGSHNLTAARPPLALKALAYASLAIPMGKPFRPMRTCKVCGWTVEVA